jgi:hypothetical protein
MECWNHGVMEYSELTQSSARHSSIPPFQHSTVPIFYHSTVPLSGLVEEEKYENYLFVGDALVECFAVRMR